MMTTSSNSADDEIADNSSLVDGSERPVSAGDGSRQTHLDYLSGIEQKLKTIWSEYIEHLDRHGFTEKTKNLKESYFRLYQTYRRNKNWKQLVSNNQEEMR